MTCIQSTCLKIRNHEFWLDQLLGLHYWIPMFLFCAIDINRNKWEETFHHHHHHHLHPMCRRFHRFIRWIGQVWRTMAMKPPCLLIQKLQNVTSVRFVSMLPRTSHLCMKNVNIFIGKHCQDFNSINRCKLLSFFFWEFFSFFCRINSNSCLTQHEKASDNLFPLCPQCQREFSRSYLRQLNGIANGQVHALKIRCMCDSDKVFDLGTMFLFMDMHFANFSLYFPFLIFQVSIMLRQ